MFEKVLVPVDGSEFGDRVLTQVRRVLLTKGARVFLVRVIPETGVSSLEDEPVVHLQRLKAALERDGVHVETRLLTGETASSILDLADDVKPSLIALSTHGRTGLKRWIRGSVAERLLHRSRFPLLLVNPFATGGSNELAFRRILVPLDGSLESSKILPFVHDLARTYESEVVLAHVLDFPPDLAQGEPLAVVAAEAQASLRAEAETMLAHWRKTLGGVSVRLAVTWGSPAAELLDMAEREKADLVALTTHGRSGTSRWLYGSVAELVLHHVHSPILVLRTAVGES
jgi:nucleotide-binding universal stress UspA family protein